MAGQFSHPPTVFVLGTADALSNALSSCSQHLSIRFEYFAQASEFLTAALNRSPDCMLIDLDEFSNVPELQAELTRRGCRAVLIAIASNVDVDTVIELMERGALTLIKKPLQPSCCESYLSKALVLARHERELQAAYESFVVKQAALSPRQREVLWAVLEGLPSKSIAAKLDVSNRLVELERSRLLKIFESESTTELALKVGEFLMLQRTLMHHSPPIFSRLRQAVTSDTPRAPDDG